MMSVILLLVAIVGFYFVKRYILDKKIGKIYSAIIWCIPFIVYSILIKETGFQFIEQKYSCIIHIIFCIVLQFVSITYTSTSVVSKNNNDKIYSFFVRPLVSEAVFLGVLIPALYKVKFLGYFFVGNDLFFLNFAIIIAVALFTAVEIYETEEGMDLLQIVLTIAITYIHSVILFRTGVIWFGLVLRIVYGIIKLVKKNKTI